MKFLVVLSVAVACVVAAPVESDFSAPILKLNSESSPEGNFQYEYETGNGIAAQAQGLIKNPTNESPELEVQGGYRYTAPDGTPIEISYVANQFGYQPSGNVIPTAPPTPEAILRSLAYIEAHPPQENIITKAAKTAYASVLG